MTISTNYPSVSPSINLDFVNSKTLDPRITFTRASTATYYDGKTSAIAEQNLLAYSNLSSSLTGWNQRSLCSATSNSVVAPDGNTTAATLIEGTGTNGAGITYGFGTFFVPAGKSFTYSVYLKYNSSRQWAAMVFYDGTSGAGYSVVFDISTGTFASAPASNTASLNGTYATPVSVGNGWYRYAITITPTTTQTNMTCNLSLSNVATPASWYYSCPIYTGDGASNILVWGNQAELHTGAGVYTPTTTTAITNYIPVLQTALANTARLDYDPVSGSAKGLLMEQASTNLQLQSGAVGTTTSGAYAISGLTANLNSNIAPDGTLTATTLVEDTSFSSPHGVIGATLTFTNAVTYTTSVYAKAGTRSILLVNSLRNGGYAGTQGAYFNLANGTIGTVTSGYTASIQAVGNGWYRCITSVVGDGAGWNLHFNICAVDGAVSYTGNGTGSIYIWGAQTEALSYQTSYIPTGASQVTRAQDFPTMSGTNFSSWFNNNQGTVYCSFDVVSITSGNFSPWGITNGSSTCYVWKTGAASLTITSGGNQTISNNITAANTTQQNTVSYSNISGVSVSGLLNGGSLATIGSGVSFPVNATKLTLGTADGSSFPMTGHIRKFAYYPVATTTAQLQALTGS